MDIKISDLLINIKKIKELPIKDSSNLNLKLKKY